VHINVYKYARSHKLLQTFLSMTKHLTVYINKIQQGATVYRYLFTAKLLYMFRVSIASIIRST